MPSGRRGKFKEDSRNGAALRKPARPESWCIVERQEQSTSSRISTCRLPSQFTGHLSYDMARRVAARSRILATFTYSSAPGYGHAQAVFRLQCYKRLRNHGMIRHELEFPLLRNGCDDQYHLRPGETFANAPPRTAAEWKVGIFRQCSPEFRRPTFRIKSERFREITRVAVR